MIRCSYFYIQGGSGSIPESYVSGAPASYSNLSVPNRMEHDSFFYIYNFTASQQNQNTKIVWGAEKCIQNFSRES
jgi:hypothetical protein